MDVYRKGKNTSIKTKFCFILVVLIVNGIKGLNQVEELFLGGSMAKTGVVWDPIYAEHTMGSYHPESPLRIKKIGEMLAESQVGKRAVRIGARPALKDELAWVHDPKYIDKIESTAGKSVVLDPDTSTSPRTWDAACMAAGGVIECVRSVFDRGVDNAYAFVRPPGHHAERNHAMGFCIFNNVAIAAEYALRKCGAKRVAIIDFDIHHGNGTQNAFYSRSEVYYISTHRWPFYPGSGAAGERGTGLGKGYTLNVPLERGDDEEFREIYGGVVPTEMRKYGPDLILISAGYDAHETDPLGGFFVTTETYNWLAKQLISVAKECCDGRIVLTLEGGYNTDSLKICAEGALSALEGS